MIDNQGRRSSELFLQTVIKQSMHIVKRSIPHIPLVSNNRLRYYGTTVTITTTTTMTTSKSDSFDINVPTSS